MRDWLVRSIAWMGMTLPAAALAIPPVALDPVVTGSSPLYVTHAGDGRLFVVERAGLIKIVEPVNGLRSTPFLDLTGVVDQAFDGGLFTVAFHPDYANNGFFFVSYTEDGGDPQTVRSVIERYTVSAGDPDVANTGSVARLVTVVQPDESHTNAQLIFGPDGMLYVGFGDGGGHHGPGCRAQHDAASLGVDAFFGKILRIDVDQNATMPPYYGIPSDNPFASPIDGVKDEIWLKGLRNPWRFSIDVPTDTLWIGDVGEEEIEEVDRLPLASGGGENLGWPVMEGDGCHDADPVDAACPVGTASCFGPSYTDPIYVYPNTGWATEGCSVTGGFVYRGSAIAGLAGAYVFGDYCGGVVWALEETSPDVWQRSALASLGFGLTSFGVDVEGELYVTHNDDVYRLVHDATGVPALGVHAIAALVAAMIASAGVVFLRRAALAHQSHDNSRQSS